MIAVSMKTLGERGMFYLAAAVSDFYVPWSSMVNFFENYKNAFIFPSSFCQATLTPILFKLMKIKPH